MGGLLVIEDMHSRRIKFISVLKQIAVAAMPAVKPDRITCEKHSHDS